ncbi:MAG: hypothetical protein ISR65_12015 [Bacteriovoracaceae bacterium]|nr:hypothetical protein [Bacteriovoracaceae bacterium]
MKILCCLLFVCAFVPIYADEDNIKKCPSTLDQLLASSIQSKKQNALWSQLQTSGVSISAIEIYFKLRSSAGIVEDDLKKYFIFLASSGVDNAISIYRLISQMSSSGDIAKKSRLVIDLIAGEIRIIKATGHYSKTPSEIYAMVNDSVQVLERNVQLLRECLGAAKCNNFFRAQGPSTFVFSKSTKEGLEILAASRRKRIEAVKHQLNVGSKIVFDQQVRGPTSILTRHIVELFNNPKELTGQLAALDWEVIDLARSKSISVQQAFIEILQKWEARVKFGEPVNYVDTSRDYRNLAYILHTKSLFNDFSASNTNSALTGRFRWNLIIRSLVAKYGDPIVIDGRMYRVDNALSALGDKDALLWQKLFEGQHTFAYNLSSPQFTTELMKTFAPVYLFPGHGL